MVFAAHQSCDGCCIDPSVAVAYDAGVDRRFA
jgi:hypothetical protein